VKKIKQVTNRWNPLEKYWEIPATEQSISRFMSVLQDEVIQLFKQVVNVKHRAILMLTYSDRS